MGHQKRLESMIDPMNLQAEQYEAEDDYSTSAIIYRNALVLYTAFTDRHPPEDSNPGYRLLLKNTKIGIDEKIREFTYGRFRDYAPLVDAAANSTYDEQIDGIMLGLGIVTPGIEPGLRDDFREWFSYLKALNCYFGVILESSGLGFYGKYELTEKDAEIIQRVTSREAGSEVEIRTDMDVVQH